MRNLYSRLGIDPSASEREIKDAIARCANSTVKTDAAEVLLNPSRRRNYDRVYRTLCDIGVLRAHLGLSHGNNWGIPESDDFSVKPTHGLSLHDEFVTKIKRLNKESKVDEFVNSIKEFIAGIFRLAAVLGTIAGVFWIISVWDANSNSSGVPQSSYSTPPQPIFNEPVLQLPPSGTIRRYTSWEGAAPLRIRTSAGSNYLVKLENVATGNNILDVFIRGGSTIKIEVPLGTYRLKYATGQRWYGYEYYFGPSTRYSKTDSNFRFYNDDYRVHGYTVTLYQVRNGNLSTSRLSPGQF